MLKWTVTKRTDANHPVRRRPHDRRSLGALQSVRTPRQIDDRPQVRRSLGSARSLGTLCDKENVCTSTPHPAARDSGALPTGIHFDSLVLRDCSNITPNLTVVQAATTTTPTNRKRRFDCTPVAAAPTAVPSQYATTLPSFDIEYSPCGPRPFIAVRGMCVPDIYQTSQRYLNFNDDTSPPTKRLKNTPLPPPPISTAGKFTTPLTNRLSELRFSKISFRRNPMPRLEASSSTNNNNNGELSLNSSEVGDVTLDRMIDAILESAKKDRAYPRRSLSIKSRDKVQKEASPSYKANDDPASDLSFFKDVGSAERTIILDEPAVYNEREVRTPDSMERKSCALRRQRGVRRKHKQDGSDNLAKRIGLTLPNGIPSPETPVFNYEAANQYFENLAQLDTPKETTFIVDSDLDFKHGVVDKPVDETPSEGANSDIKTSDVQGSSTPTGAETNVDHTRRCLSFSTSVADDSLDKRRSVASSIGSRNSRTSMVNGSLDVALFADNGQLIIHVIRCRDLLRLNGNSINAYVKVALLPAENNDNVYQRTAVHRNSSRPYFDHRFVVDLKDGDANKRVQLAVWHRDRQCKRSEFLGCMSFPVKNVIKKEIHGSYKLQPQHCLTNPSPPTLATTMGETSHSSVDDIVNLDDAAIASAGLLGGGFSSGSVNAGSSDQISLSKKAIHQRDADENLFLRFLELDPPEEEASTSPAPTVVAPLNASPIPSSYSQQSRRMSSYAKSAPGRTPFTITKKLTRTLEKGFGFSIVWTHPPRIEKIEHGLSAEKAGILPGDYVIFVDKHNVVTMPEIDILNLIKTQGNTLVLEIFRRPGKQPTNGLMRTNSREAGATKLLHLAGNLNMPNLLNNNTSSNNFNNNNLNINNSISNVANHSSELRFDDDVLKPLLAQPRSSTACSNASIETSKRRLNLPQVTFSKESILPSTPEDPKKKFLYQLINREQHFISALQFGIERFVIPLKDRKDLISPNDHKILFQNIDELVRISEDIMEQLMQDDTEPQIHFSSRVYLTKCTAICAAYKKYCSGLKKADCILVNKSRITNCDFMKFITEPPVPRKRPDLTSFIHRPLQHFREILKLVQLLASHCKIDSEEQNNFNSVINELQAAYREITVGGGLMEPLGDGRPLLTLQDLESRLVFTKCKPFVLATPGRQWIFGGDLSRVEGRSVKPYWALLFSDILLFAKVSRDRVLFITEEPLLVTHVVDSTFMIRKRPTEFRITIDPGGRLAESPTTHCSPNLSSTPRKNCRRRTVVLRAPSTELKAVWQNLLTRQILLVNATLGATPLSSPLESPDIIQTFVPLGNCTISNPSIGMYNKTLDNNNARNSQTHHHHQSPLEQSKHIEELIDEKCRILNKTGVARGSAIHLAQWMKGQLDKQVIKSDPIDSDPEEKAIEEWSPEQLRKRSRELKLIDANGNCQLLQSNHGPKMTPERKTDDGGIASEVEEESKSPSRSTTSDSQITVRSSPISNQRDTVSVCKKCHKNCKNNFTSSNSLKVQHSQLSPNHCCSSTLSNLSSASSTLTNKTPTNSTSQSTGERPLLSNGGVTSSGTDSAKSPVQKQPPKKAPRKHIPTMCVCKCAPKDFAKATSPDELIHGTIKILDDVNDLDSNRINSRLQYRDIRFPNDRSSPTASRDRCQCTCGSDSKGKGSDKSPFDDIEDWSHMLIDLAQISPATKLVNIDPFEAVPSIAVVPPTPDYTTTSTSMKYSRSTIWDHGKLQLTDIKETLISNVTQEQSLENSPDDSPQDEEPPYLALNSGLKRYGTLSSLEKVQSEDTDEKTYNSSEDSDNDIKIITKEVYTNGQSFRNWTARAGSFLEESRAFIDRYLGRRENEDGKLQDEVVEGETSGATSGEEVWGTPTSGGENDELNIFNSTDGGDMSPTKSSSSMGDEDTELMMDELLMAPPMTASMSRGLLPRWRRLEPLVEEESESGESEKDLKESDDSSSDQGHAVAAQPENVANLNDPTESCTEKTTPSSMSPIAETVKTTTPIDSGRVADKCFASVQLPSVVENFAENIGHVAAGDTVKPAVTTPVVVHSGLSPRLEMRLALNNDILGDEDLINYNPTPDLISILGHDLSTYHRMSGKDIIMNRIINRPMLTASQGGAPMVAAAAVGLANGASSSGSINNNNGPMINNNSIGGKAMSKDGTNSLYPQNNSKMDTPIPSRRKPSHSTWSSFGFADRKESSLSDLERLARREKIYCMTQLSSNLKFGNNLSHDDLPKTRTGKLFNFLRRRHSENQLARTINLPTSIDDTNSSIRSNNTSPKAETDKPLDRRFWKQLSRRRRSYSISEISSN